MPQLELNYWVPFLLMNWSAFFILFAYLSNAHLLSSESLNNSTQNTNPLINTPKNNWPI